MTLNDLELPQKGFLVNFSQFLEAAHISTLNCDEMAGDRARQPAYEIFSIKRRLQLSKSQTLVSRRPAAHRIHLPAGQRISTHSAQRRKLTAGQLSRFHHKRPVASKFAECKLGGLSRVVSNVGAYRKLKTKPKTIAELKESLQVIWSNLPQAATDKTV